MLVTTTCVLKLIEEGTITLKTKIADILPQFGQKELTIKDCITHSSGLPADINGYKQMKDDAEMIEAVWKMELEYPTGTQVKYSDVNFILLGLVIAKLKGSLDGYAKQVMFDPLEMSETGYRPDASLRLRCCAEEVMESRGGVVRGVVHDGKAFKLGGVSGHAGVFSTLEDISHYITMLLNDGVYKGKQFFSKRADGIASEMPDRGIERKTLNRLGALRSELCVGRLRQRCLSVSHRILRALDHRRFQIGHRRRDADQPRSSVPFQH